VRSASDSSDEDDEELDELHPGRSQRWESPRRDVGANAEAPLVPPVTEIYKRQGKGATRLKSAARESKHWYHEAKGRRLEQDYADVLHKLRKL
jgi:hypothetical protein